MDKNENEKSFDSIIKEKLKDYTLLPDEICWATIAERLNKKSKKTVLWYWISGIAVAAVVWIGLIFPLHRQTILQETSKQLSGYEEKMTKDVFEEENQPAVSSPIIAHKRNIHPRKRQETISGESTFIPDTEVIDSMTDDFSFSEYAELKKDIPDVLALVSAEETTYFAKTSKHSNSLAFHIGSGNNLPNINEKAPMYENSDGNFFNDKISKNAPSYLEVLTENSFNSITHYAPLSFGLTFKKELNATFALETGLIYTFLASKFENENPKRDAILHLHYLGIPFNLHTKLYGTSLKQWNIYLSTGFMIEKGLLSHYAQNEYYGTVIVSAYSNEQIDGLQCSLNIALGVEYKLFKDYGIYFEPKINYYMENNQPMSARTENPLIIGLNAGIRWHWQ